MTTPPRPSADHAPDRTTVAALVAVALNAGVFLAFSAFVMPAVVDLPTTQGVAAMQALNRFAPAPFTIVGLGAGVLCVVVIVRARGALASARARWAISGAVLFLVTGLLVTFGVSVPTSASIDQLVPAGPDVGSRWSGLSTRWVWVNHLRTLGATSAALCCAVALRRPAA